MNFNDIAHMFVSFLVVSIVVITVFYSIFAFFLTIKKLSNIVDYTYVLFNYRKNYPKDVLYRHWVVNIKTEFAYFLLFLPGFLIFILGVSEILRGNIILSW
jgi:hypothetical protein